MAANNDFSSPIHEQREAQLVYVRDLIRMAGDFGAKAVRMFFAWPGVSKDKETGHFTYQHAYQTWNLVHEFTTEADTWRLCRDGLVESARLAGDHGVTLALQNHRPVVKDWRDVLRMIKEVDSPHLKACLDVPIMRDKSPENIRRAARELGPLQVLSHFSPEWRPGKEDPSEGPQYYDVFVRAMKEIGYGGYIGYELCHPLPIVDGRKVGIEYADKNARLAAEFMRRVVDRVYREA